MTIRPKTSVRIIGGIWNGRKIILPATPELRPSSDRLRETLFNCLRNTIHLHEKHCLDLFAGTGVLGLCAASHGAAHVTFVEKNRSTAKAIEQITTDISANATILATSALHYLAVRRDKTPFDLIFLDPPFKDYMQDPAWWKLLTYILPHTNDNTHVYCESNRHFALPPHWRQQYARRTASVYWQIILPPLLQEALT